VAKTVYGKKYTKGVRFEAEELPNYDFTNYNQSLESGGE